MKSKHGLKVLASGRELLMRIRNLVNGSIEVQCQLEFAQEIALENINRGKSFAMVIIILEMALFLANLYFSHFSHKTVSMQHGFQNSVYGLMYGITIVVTCIYLYLSSCLKKRAQMGQIDLPYIEKLMVSYLTFIMTWSAVITLFDQRLYGSISAYLVALILGSIIFYVNSRMLIIPYLISLSILMIGLPFYQPSTAILIGHYVNIGILLILSWVMAKTLYENYVRDFASRWEIKSKNDLLNTTNRQLSDEVILRKTIQEELEKANQELKKLTLIDDLTGIPNRRNLEDYLNREWNRAIREGNSISILMIDIDYFKAFNDNYGHLSGDDCLIKVAQTIKSHCRRSSDFVARLGGEEFLFIAINMDEEGTRSLADNIRNSIQNINILHEYSEAAPYLTVSIGITMVRPSTNDKPGPSINKADRALYTAKLAGRNRVASSI